MKVFGKLRKQISEREQLQTVLMIGAVLSWLTQELLSFFIMEDGVWALFLILGYVGTAILSFFFYSRFLTTKFTLQQKENEHRLLQFYLNEVEQQQAAIRKYKHDLQNIFSTLDIFIVEKDWDGLMQFYPKVKVASDIITKNEFELEGLSKIKVQEVKNILIAKLSMAQNLKINVKFDAVDDIDSIPVDSVSMVRMIGIIMDNAIEELQSLGTGQLLVGCFKVENSINFIVQNTCGPDVPPLRQIRQSGFSTKGKNRGLGLSNLYELTDSLPNVALMTSIENGQFIQKLIIGNL